MTTTLRGMALEILARYPGQFVAGTTICDTIREEHPEIAARYPPGDLSTCVAKYLRTELKWGTVECVRHAGGHRYTGWRLVR